MDETMRTFGESCLYLEGLNNRATGFCFGFWFCFFGVCFFVFFPVPFFKKKKKRITVFLVVRFRRDC